MGVDANYLHLFTPVYVRHRTGGVTPSHLPVFVPYPLPSTLPHCRRSYSFRRSGRPSGLSYFVSPLVQGEEDGGNEERWSETGTTPHGCLRHPRPDRSFSHPRRVPVLMGYGVSHTQ